MNKSYQNFKKRAGKLAVALTLVGTTVAGGMAIGADGADAATVKSGYTSTAVNLRKSASTKSARLTTIKKGAKVTILKTSGKWLKVKYNGKTGYVYKTYVKKTFTTKDYSGKFKLKTDLNVRKGPGTSFVKAGTLKKGTVVTVKGKTSNGWYTITYKGSTRYISASSKYLTKYVAPTPKPEKNNAPTISVNDTYTLVKGENFEFSMLKATASDKEDGDLTSKIDFSGVVNTGKVGEYPVKLTVKDSKGATATKTVKVIVNESTENTAPIIAGDSIIYLDQTEINNFNTNMLGAVAYDNEDGKLTNISYSGDVNTSVAGTYNVTLSVTDKNGATTNKVVQVIVKDSSAPEISANAKYFVTAGQKVNTKDLGITAFDKEDGDLTDRLAFDKDVIDATYLDPGKKIPFTVSVKDNSGKVTTVKDIVVEVTKNAPPEVAFVKDSKGHPIRSITIYEGEKLTRASLISKLGVTGWDKEDGKIDIREEYVSLGNYEDKVNMRWGYRAYITAVDSCGLTSKKEEVTIYVKSIEKPYIKYVLDKNALPTATITDNGDGYHTLKIPQYVDFDIADLGAFSKYVDPTTGRELDAKLTYSNTTVGNDLHTTYRIVVTATYGNRVTTEYVDVVRTPNAKPVIKTSNASEAHEWYYVGDTNTLTLTYGTPQDVIENKIIPKIVKVTDDEPGVKYTVSKVETQKIGPTVLTITATDNDGAKVEFSINVNVVDKIDQIIK